MDAEGIWENDWWSLPDVRYPNIRLYRLTVLLVVGTLPDCCVSYDTYLSNLPISEVFYNIILQSVASFDHTLDSASKKLRTQGTSHTFEPRPNLHP